MREGIHYRCPSCDDRSPFGSDCPRCEVPMLDEHGNAALPLPAGALAERKPLTDDEAILLSIAAIVVITGVLSSLVGPAIALATGALVVVGWRVYPHVSLLGLGDRARSLLRRGWARVGPRLPGRRRRGTDLPLERIVEVEPGPCRIRGAVTVLRPVLESYGAYRRTHVYRELVPTGFDDVEPVMSPKRFEEERHGCGRIAVSDGQGVALLDEDALRIVGYPEDDIALVDGTEVEVIGHATVLSTEASLDELPNDYRSAPRALLFDGTPATPLLVRPLRGALRFERGTMCEPQRAAQRKAAGEATGSHRVRAASPLQTSS